MNFATLPFIALFFPICIAAYLLANKTQYRNCILILFSMLFYACGRPIELVLLLLTTAINFLLARSIDANRTNKLCKLSFAIALIYDIGMLFVFKYTDFLIGNLNQWFGLSLPTADLTLPLGISFYTFQILSYIIDVYWENVPVQKKFSKLLLYISLFPQLVAGPIVRYSTVAEEIDNRHTSLTDLTEGFTRVLIGLGKKVIVANHLKLLAELYLTTTVDTASVFATWIGVISYSMQVYFDFSGYSDMAIGMGRIFGFHFDENFNYPFICRSIQEFWQRWHISLGSFFRDYLLYVPIFGKRRQWMSLFLVWFTTGLWHGASWNFIVWGLYFGVFIFIEQKLGKKTLKKIPDVAMHIYNKIVIIIGFGIFYQDNCTSFDTFLSKMGSFFGNLFGFSGHGFFNGAELTNGPLNKELNEPVYFTKYVWLFLIAIIACLPIVPALKKYVKTCSAGVQSAAQVLSALFCIGLLVVSVIMIIASKNNPFLYFRF
ncbi:MAG: MBOAT family protein [Clostridiales bacterium]|nr:MBOAT family protein [Candidatus Coliplasma caballi]